jgi:ribosome recycling factor
MCEESKVSIRNNRRDCIDKIKAAEKEKVIDKDTSKFCQV